MIVDQLHVLFAQDPGFSAPRFHQQMAVMRGQVRGVSGATLVRWQVSLT